MAEIPKNVVVPAEIPKKGARVAGPRRLFVPEIKQTWTGTAKPSVVTTLSQWTGTADGFGVPV